MRAPLPPCSGFNNTGNGISSARSRSAFTSLKVQVRGAGMSSSRRSAACAVLLSSSANAAALERREERLLPFGMLVQDGDVGARGHNPWNVGAAPRSVNHKNGICLFGLDVCGADDAAPFLDLGGELRGERA